jgi:hypothetical protein
MNRSTESSGRHELALQIARDYVRATKRWPEPDYHLEFLRTEGGPRAPVLVLEAVHHDDFRSAGRGPSRSLQLYVDISTQRVVRELAYQ